MQEPDYFQLLAVLKAHGVSFIIVGGVAAVLQDAPIGTIDLDIVHERSPNNLGLLESALKEVDAHYRLHGSRHLAPPLSALQGPGHQLLQSDHGPVDVLGTIGQGQSYHDLLPHTRRVDLGDGLEVTVLNLEKIIEFKQQLGRDKDRAMLPTLIATLNERNRRR